MEIVGQIRFDGFTLDVYNSLDEPYFRAYEVAKLIGYSEGKTSQMLELIEKVQVYEITRKKKVSYWE